MNRKSLIEIFRGDDSDALGYQTIVGTIKTDLDLSGCKAVFRYLGFFQEFDPIPEDGKLTIVIPAASSRMFPPGLGYASLKVYDIDKRVRTFTNRIPVLVSTVAPCRGCGEFSIYFSPFPELEPLKIFKGPGAEDFDNYTGFVSKIIDRAGLEKYGLALLADAMSDEGGDTGKAATPRAVKAAYDAIIRELTDNYYTAQETDEAIDALAAYYITSDAAGNPFPTHAALMSATKFYSGGVERIPTRNDYCVVLADETHDDAEYRYIYAEADVESGDESGDPTGVWQAQYPVGGTMTIDTSVTRTSVNPVASSGIWSAIWGALAALPTGFSSLYDWVVAQIAKLRDKLDLNVYDYGNPVASFADGFSVVDSQGGGARQRYTAPSGGETITFIGPVPSSNPYLSNYKFYYPSTLGTLDSFDPDNYSVWCLVCLNGGTTPSYMMYRTGPYYYIGSFNSVTPTLTLGMGEATGDAPIMTRPLGATGDTLAKVSQMNAALAGKQDALSAQQLANIAAVPNKANDSAVVHKSGDTMTGTLVVTGQYVEINVGPELSVDDQRARLSQQELQVSNGNSNDLKLAHYWYDCIQLQNGESSVTVGFPSANGTLALKGEIPYDRITITTGQLQDHAKQKVTLSAATTTLTLPALTDLTGKVSDFGIDIVNGYEVSGTPTAASFQLDGTIGTDYNLIVPEGEDWSEMSTLAAGEMAVYYFTLSAFQINDKPTWEVMKKVVTLVPVPSAP